MRQRGKRKASSIVKKDKRQSPDVNIQIETGIREHLLRSADQLQKAAAKEETSDHKDGTQQTADDHGSGDGGLHFIIFFCAEEGRYDHGASDVASEGKGNEDQSDLITVADGRQGVFAREFSCDQAVRDIV